MATNFLTTISNTFYWMKIYEFCLRFHWRFRMNNIPALAQIMAWRRPDDKPLYEPMKVSYWRIYASLGLNTLNMYLNVYPVISTYPKTLYPTMYMQDFQGRFPTRMTTWLEHVTHITQHNSHTTLTPIFCGQMNILLFDTIWCGSTTMCY